jgi:ribosomal protein S18 acetylase RimI-like enzyme
MLASRQPKPDNALPMRNKSIGIDIQVISENAAPAALLTAPIGHAAWKNQFPDRTNAEINYVYGDTACHTSVLESFDDLQRANTFGLRMREYGRGAVFVAYVHSHPTERLTQRFVGYAVMRNNVSGNWLQRATKTYGAHRLPYAWLRSINVIPEYQGKGVGSALIAQLAEKFELGQISTTYVFEENNRALHYFETLGYRANPQIPTQIADYFGPSTAPVQQLRLQAPLGAVGQRARERSIEQGKQHGVTFTFGKHME